jgi:hypothetical protein
MESHMTACDDEKVIATTSFKMENNEFQMERLLSQSGQEKLRISSSGGKGKSNTLVFTELEILELLHHAIHTGVLPRDFIGKLRERIEI